MLRRVTGGATGAPSAWLPLAEAECTQTRTVMVPQDFSEGPHDHCPPVWPRPPYSPPLRSPTYCKVCEVGPGRGAEGRAAQRGPHSQQPAPSRRPCPRPLGGGSAQPLSPVNGSSRPSLCRASCPERGGLNPTVDQVGDRGAPPAPGREVTLPLRVPRRHLYCSFLTAGVQE